MGFIYFRFYTVVIWLMSIIIPYHTIYSFSWRNDTFEIKKFSDALLRSDARADPNQVIFSISPYVVVIRKLGIK